MKLEVVTRNPDGSVEVKTTIPPATKQGRCAWDCPFGNGCTLKIDAGYHHKPGPFCPLRLAVGQAQPDPSPFDPDIDLEDLSLGGLPVESAGRPKNDSEKALPDPLDAGLRGEHLRVCYSTFTGREASLPGQFYHLDRLVRAVGPQETEDLVRWLVWNARTNRFATAKQKRAAGTPDALLKDWEDCLADYRAALLVHEADGLPWRSNGTARPSTEKVPEPADRPKPTTSLFPQNPQAERARRLTETIGVTPDVTDGETAAKAQDPKRNGRGWIVPRDYVSPLQRRRRESPDLGRDNRP